MPDDVRLLAIPLEQAAFIWRVITHGLRWSCSGSWAYRGIVAEEPRAQPPDRDRNSTPAVTDDQFWRIPSV